MSLSLLKSQSGVNKSVKSSQYKGGRSLYEFLPWVDYEPKNKLWLLEDGVSVATLIDIQPKSCEARPEKYLEEINESINTVINSVPQCDSPFILQFFVYNEESLRGLKKRLNDHIPDDVRETQLTQEFIKIFSEHLDLVSQKKGVFYDDDITDSLWYAKTYNVKLCVYRRIDNQLDLEEGVTPTEELLDVSDTIIKGLSGCGVKSNRIGQQELYEWLLPVFNDLKDYDDSIDKLLDAHPYPGDENIPWGTDLVKLLFLSEPESNVEKGTWEFGESLYKASTVNAYRKVPELGHLSAERRQSDKYFAVLDKFPSGTITNITVVIENANITKSNLSKMQKSAKGDSAEARNTAKQASDALDYIERNDFLYPVITTFYVKGGSREELSSNYRIIKTLLMNNNIHLIESKDDEIPLNQFCTNLPFCYDFRNDKNDVRSRYLFSSQISKLVPLYGRSRGTGNPGLVFFNRGAEDFSFDILKDRASNAFGAILGPPGSGKSALLVFMIWMWAAMYRPRFFILEKGDSFKLLGEYLEHNGMSVNRLALKPNADASLPPFVNATTMIEEDGAAMVNIYKELGLDFDESLHEAVQVDEDDMRDYLGEMELLARVMITAGDEREEDELRAEHKVAIRQAIKNAAINRVKEKLINQNIETKNKIVRPEHVIEELELLSEKAPAGNEKDKLRAMYKSMSRYVDGLQADLFNGGGETLPEVDVTIMDFGIFAREGYEGELALSFMTQMQQISKIAERDQYSGRPIIVIGDEAHLFLKNSLLAPYLVKMAKMFRKVNTWPWLATQNLEDWADESKKMLTMFEWFIAMACPKEEIDQLAKFRNITNDQKVLLESAHKMRGKYTEGVVMGKTVEPSLFRNVPPGFALAIAMSDPDEKAVRKELMDKMGITELDAVMEIANQMNKKRVAL